ncbi:hypothetical protein [Nocardioides soli]|uniref:Uncharacterized protein n=1 Tax=Nocardioides soli TaxID=1036020 RepID=A0A7W4VXF9_9ACTN|nr:hypothetical protein [Nocardioides soli]MBB3043092.1 hypothetical protein [Nocardioides soli]
MINTDVSLNTVAPFLEFTTKTTAKKVPKPEPKSLIEALNTKQAALIKVRANGTKRSLPYLAVGTDERKAGGEGRDRRRDRGGPERVPGDGSPVPDEPGPGEGRRGWQSRQGADEGLEGGRRPHRYRERRDAEVPTVTRGWPTG